MGSLKSNAAFYWVLVVMAVATSVFIYLIKDEEPVSQPKIALSYYSDEHNMADAVSNNLSQEIKENKFYWIGVEPGKNEHIDMASALIKQLKLQHTIENIIVDLELNLTDKMHVQLGTKDMVSIKENMYTLGEKLQEFEKNGNSYILVTASIYTNSLLKKNPLHILKEKYKLDPLTFSFAYFPTAAADEKNMVFDCRSDDRTGTSPWGCAIVNRARFARKKIAVTQAEPWLGLMDVSSKKNYILLLKKNDK